MCGGTAVAKVGAESSRGRAFWPLCLPAMSKVHKKKVSRVSTASAGTGERGQRKATLMWRFGYF